jgi:hypothetical protein
MVVSGSSLRSPAAADNHRLPTAAAGVIRTAPSFRNGWTAGSGGRMAQVA